MTAPQPVQRVMLASQAKQSNNTDILSFPAKIGPHGLLMIFREYTFQRPTTRALLKLPTGSGGVTSQSNGAILLPVPNSLIDSNSMRISRSDLLTASMLGAEAAASAAAGAKAAYNNAGGGITGLGAVANEAGAAMQAATNQLSNFNSQDALFLARKLFGDNLLLGPISQGLGATMNPKASLLFEGVEMKEYAFEWTLAPTEQEESDLLKKIIQRLKVNSLPSYSKETAFMAAMLSYPATVDMYLLGVDPSYYFYFKTAMISNLNVNYTPNGLSILRGGKPSAVTISMQLKEMDIHTSDDYITNGSP